MKKPTFASIPAEILPAYESAYDIYVKHYNMYDKVSKKLKNLLRRQCEATLHETGFRGVDTGLITPNAWKTVIQMKKQNGKTDGIAHNQRLSTEHPIPPRVIAQYCLTRPECMSFEEYINTWFTNYVKVTTTSEENQALKPYQANLVFNESCWLKDAYDKVIDGQLFERPSLRSKADRAKWGINT